MSDDWLMVLIVCAGVSLIVVVASVLNSWEVPPSLVGPERPPRDPLRYPPYILLLLAALPALPQGFSLPEGVEGLIKGQDFEIQYDCKCARIYFTTPLGPAAEQGHIVVVSLDNSAKDSESPGKPLDPVSTQAIVKILDAIVHYRFPQFDHWQEVVTGKNRVPLDPDRMTIGDVADHAHSLYNCGLAQGMLDALRKTNSTAYLVEGQSRTDKACANILGLMKQLDKMAAEAEKK